jgi:hypothetical protein
MTYSYDFISTVVNMTSFKSLSLNLIKEEAPVSVIKTTDDREFRPTGLVCNRIHQSINITHNENSFLGRGITRTNCEQIESHEY